MEPKQLHLGTGGEEPDTEPLFPDEDPEAPETERTEEKPKSAGGFLNAHGVIVTDEDIPF
jgi:hypothetical protein